jgi:hypothetical protein
MLVYYASYLIFYMILVFNVFYNNIFYTEFEYIVQQ